MMLEPPRKTVRAHTCDAPCSDKQAKIGAHGAELTALLLVRHGERQDYVDPTWLPANRGAEPWNPPLSPKGQEQGEALVSAVDTWCSQLGLKLGAVYSSPLLRTMQTAKPVAAHFGLDVVAVPDLMEWLAVDFYTSWACRDSTGHWGSGSVPVLPEFTEVVRQPAANLIGRKSGPQANFDCPESKQEMVDRVTTSIRRLADSHPRQLVLIVGHGGPTRYCAECLAQVGSSPGLPPAGYTGIYVLVGCDGHWKLSAANDTRHLRSAS